ncbi:MAG: FAD-dependent oxidoreductase [Spirochaetia bacterium]
MSKMRKEFINETYDLAVVGGGMSGLLAAIAAARHGAKTILIQNRPVLGGNASSEIRMHICGALSNNHSRPDSRETGILEEIMLENAYRNPQSSFSVFDTILWEKAAFQDGLTLRLNTHMTDVFTSGSRIDNILCEQLTTEKSFQIRASIYIDATGDGTLAHLAGADSMRGREGQSAFDEPHAPEKPDHYTMGNTLLFQAKDAGRPVRFEKPFWADTFSEADFKYRELEEITSGYWWIELGGDSLDTVSDGEQIRDDLLKKLYGIWDHIKNSGNYPSENLVMDWVGFLPGKRESRRIRGWYVLTENDVLAAKKFNDTVAYGGWPMDLHVPGGLLSKDEPTTFLEVPEVYGIPYRCLLPHGVDNLITAGRAVSASHIAFASLRVMGTTAVIGQAAGTAAAAAVERKTSPGDVLAGITEIQLRLDRDDCYLPGISPDDPDNISVGCTVTASSYKTEGKPEYAVNGKSRAEHGKSNCWISDSIGEDGEWIELKCREPIKAAEIDIRFDSGLSKEIMLSISETATEKFFHGVPEELVKDYRLELFLDDEPVSVEEVSENYLRHRVHRINSETVFNKLKLTGLSTRGADCIRIFEIRIYRNLRYNTA